MGRVEDSEDPGESYQRGDPDPRDAGDREQFPRSTAVADLMRDGLQRMKFDELLDETCESTARTLDVDYSHVFQLRPAHGDLVLRAGVSWPEAQIDSVTMDVKPDSQNGYTVTSWQPTVVTDIREEDRFEPSALMEEMGIVSGVTVVIPAPADPWGVFGAHSRKPRAFDELDTTFVQSMGQVLSAAVAKRRLEEEKHRFQKRLEHFAYTASHDLQEPLRMVSSYLELIEDRYGELLDEEGREFFLYATEGAERMRRMIQSLLRLAQVVTEGSPFEPVDAQKVLEEAKSDLELEFQETDAELIVDELPTVHADPDQLRQVFQNLLSNAVKYSGDDPPRIHVTAKRTGDFWRFSVLDEGIGIPTEDVDKVFNPFHRLEGRPADAEGTGSGLAICEQIVDRHDGRIWVNTEFDEGTEFFFTIPAVTNGEE